MTKEEMRALAELHWEYVESVLNAHETPPVEIKRARFHYVSAFIHGMKHGLEAKDSPEPPALVSVTYNEKDEVISTKPLRPRDADPPYGPMETD